MTIALLLRRKLETPGATAALVTPDRELARRVAAELRRWGIDIDDSAGLPLNRTPPGVFLRLVLDLADERAGAGAVAGGAEASAGRRRARPRGVPRPGAAARTGDPRAAPGAGLCRSARRPRRGPARSPALPTGSKPASARCRICSPPTAPLAGLATAHIAAAERLAATDTESGVARLWRDAAGETAARFCHELIDAARDFPPLPGRHYPALFEALAAGAVVRPAYGRHPRLAIWGLVEARLQQADLVVLGGLNEGTWPGPPPTTRGCRGRCGTSSASPCPSGRSASPRMISPRRSPRRKWR